MISKVEANSINNANNNVLNVKKNKQDNSKIDDRSYQVVDPRDILGAKNATAEAWQAQNQIIVPDKKIIIPDNKLILPEKKLDTIDTSQMTKVSRFGAVNPLPNTIFAHYLYPGCRTEYFNSKDQMESVVKFSKEEWTDNGVCNAKEETTISSKNPFFATKKITDFEHNSTTVLEMRNPLDYDKIKFLKQITEYRDKDNKPERTVTYEASDITGVYNVTEKNLKTGKVNKLCEVTKNDDGSYSIKKDLVSLDGTRTQSLLQKDASGNHTKLTKKITDKDGNLVLDFSRTYDRVNDELAYSSVNNRQYKIHNKKNRVTVTDLATNEVKTLKTGDFKKSSFDNEGREIKWKNLEPSVGKEDDSHIDYLFRNLPGDTLLNLANDVGYITKARDGLESFFWRINDNTMLNTGTELMIVNHELGHAHDSEFDSVTGQYGKVEEKDKEFKQMYYAERDAFIKNFPDFEEKYIDYFIFSPQQYETRGQAETIAETNAINGLAPEIPECIAMRTIYLEQYFPKSIAVVSKHSTSIHIPDVVYENKKANTINK